MIRDADANRAIPFERFCAAAEKELRERAEQLRDIVSLNEVSGGLWHPYGFAVFKLEPPPGFGTLRLHIWAEGHRRCRDGHPAVHEHEWDLAGLVLAGVYTDELFSVQATPLPTHNTLYEIKSEAGGLDRFKATGEQVQISSSARTHYKSGEIHFIEAGVFHATPIPLESFAATLVLTSPPVQPHRAIAGSLEEDEMSYARPVVTDSERRFLLNQLLQRLDAKFL